MKRLNKRTKTNCNASLTRAKFLRTISKIRIHRFIIQFDCRFFLSAKCSNVFDKMYHRIEARTQCQCFTLSHTCQPLIVLTLFFLYRNSKNKKIYLLHKKNIRNSLFEPITEYRDRLSYLSRDLNLKHEISTTKTPNRMNQTFLSIYECSFFFCFTYENKILLPKKRNR